MHLPSVRARVLLGRLALVLVLTAVLAGAAHAKSHLWKFKEVFSNADGTIQYIEMEILDPEGTGEWVTNTQELTSNTSTFTVPGNLPDENTYLRSMLFGTAEFAALPGAPTPDWIIPANFFDPSGDELRWRDWRDVYAFTSGQVPIDGIHALQRSDGSQPVNTPTNFAGATGTVNASPGIGMGDDPVWIAVLVAMLGIGAFMALARRGESVG